MKQFVTMHPQTEEMHLEESAPAFSQNWQPEPQEIFVPSAEQLERAEALQRFNRWTIYVPIGILAAAVSGLLVYLLILAIRPPFEDTRLFLSGIADIILIIFMLPVVLFFGLLLAGIIGGGIYWRQSRQPEGEPTLQQKYGRFRLLLWKIDKQLSTLYRQVDRITPKVATPVIRFNAIIAYINSWLTRLTRPLNHYDAE